MNMKDNELVTEYIKTYSKLMVNMNTGRGINRLDAKERKLRAEMVKRGIITQEQANDLNS